MTGSFDGRTVNAFGRSSLLAGIQPAPAKWPENRFPDTGMPGNFPVPLKGHYENDTISMEMDVFRLRNQFIYDLIPLWVVQQNRTQNRGPFPLYIVVEVSVH